MNWEAIGAIGEIVAAAGVIASLIFVGWQLLQNTDALRTSTSQSHVEFYNAMANNIAANRELRRDQGNSSTQPAITPNNALQRGGMTFGHIGYRQSAHNSILSEHWC